MKNSAMGRWRGLSAVPKRVASLFSIALFGPILLGLGACATPPQQGSPSGQSVSEAAIDVKSLITLSAGNKLHIEVAGHPELSGIVPISSAGTLAHNDLGVFDVSSMTVRGLEARLAKEIQKSGDALSSVTIALLNPRPIYLIGEIEKAGAVPFRPGLSVAKAVAQAGGYTYRAESRRIFVTRASSGADGEITLDANALLLPGDIIRVSQQYF